MRIVEEWNGGANIAQSHYRLVCHDDGRYETQILIKPQNGIEPQYRELGRFEHLKAQQLAAHFTIDDKERIERREIRNEFVSRLKRA